MEIYEKRHPFNAVLDGTKTKKRGNRKILSLSVGITGLLIIKAGKIE